MIGPSQRPVPDHTQHSQNTDIYASSGIRTRDPINRAATELRRRMCGHWDRLHGKKYSDIIIIYWISVCKCLDKMFGVYTTVSITVGLAGQVTRIGEREI